MTAFVPLSGRAGNEGASTPLDLASVVYSPRFLGAGEYPYNITNKAKEFHATSTLWVYMPTNSVSKLNELLSITPIVGVSVNASTTQVPDALQVDYHSGLSMKGSWMTWPGSWWGCMNRVAWRNAIAAHVNFWKSQGVLHFQFDDPEHNDYLARGYNYLRGTGSEVGTVASGGVGCFCAECQSAAVERGFGTLTPSNMRAFQRASNTNYWSWLGGVVRSNSNARLSGNLKSTQQLFGDAFTVDRFAYAMSEVSSSQTTGDAILRNWQTVRTVMVQTMASNTQGGYEEAFGASDKNRRWMAGVYACGMLPIVPWDVFAGTGIPRIFGARSDIADITGFVRAVGQDLLSGYSLASALGETVVGPDLLDAAAWASTRQAFVTVRYRHSDGRRVIHVVDMRDTQEPVTVYWWNSVVGRGPVTVWQPAPYNESAQNAAIESGNLASLATSSAATVSVSGLVHSVTLGAGLWRILEVAE